eukprot:13666853-Alexandrium_andersonii.AAC.1
MPAIRSVLLALPSLTIYASCNCKSSDSPAAACAPLLGSSARAGARLRGLPPRASDAPLLAWRP